MAGMAAAGKAGTVSPTAATRTTVPASAENRGETTSEQEETNEWNVPGATGVGI